MRIGKGASFRLTQQKPFLHRSWEGEKSEGKGQEGRQVKKGKMRLGSVRKNFDLL
jgi:hypothetical protein